MPPLPIDPASLPLSLASCSIGLPRHTFHQKLEAISRAGFQGIELSFPDLVAHAQELQSLQQLPPELATGGEISDDNWPVLIHTASHIRHLCETHHLAILMLQPFANYEGWTDATARGRVLARARGWAQIMTAAGTSLLQVGSTDSPAHKITSSREALAADLAKLADLLRDENPAFRIAYENWCWATHAPGWKHVWEIVQLAGRDNIGLCLDTFQSAGGEWGDPTASSGLVESAQAREGEGGQAGKASPLQDKVTESWLASLRALVQAVPADKIYLLQISDAYKVDPPLAPHPEPNNEDEGLRPRGRWSHDYRPLPHDGGYLPIEDFTRAVLETGFRGWLSVEVFDGRFEEKYGDDLEGYAEKARESTRRLVKEAAGREAL